MEDEAPVSSWVVVAADADVEVEEMLPTEPPVVVADAAVADSTPTSLLMHAHADPAARSAIK